MPKIEKKIAEIAAEAAARQHTRITQIERELADIEDKKLNLQTQLAAAHIAHKRLSDFKVPLGTDYPCPTCCERGTFGTLYSIGSDDAQQRLDRYRCRVCEATFEFPF